MNMNKLNQKAKRNIVRTFAALCVGMLSFGFTACDDDLDVTQAYPFTVETMPVPKELAQGETAEIRCELVREGEFDGAVYTIRYFQYDGEGTLKLDNGLVLQPNDRYLLENEKFRLYYTSECDESQNLTVTVEDNFGNVCEWELEFNNDSDMETEGGIAVSDTLNTSR
ncbi:DUF3872 domain-containing protein [Phocaeicola vulgatus]|uniref:DUF3872 domain-containing protein n=1 Tax=Phocaeicola vulgatus TaxID=821 RepID=A0A6I1BEZ2_PHOVU|nr:DUF3872 domain-containing protein [Phocaeicola vulgatus]KAB3548695.1 DUF3872 domain-containing protein [Phocaeicola vulgatus]KAB3548782.1 DUF3872 domain-containing protein [Phocaeicola vulgatus]KAB3549132.1 DUF3872 domain-containing protein [Phocaeicola vulgatus]KAB3561681.1 DUF3872 domain-containing protein [Phocaeicola vulgatus]KAB3573959.1 DUF3872 domain-containing protein [Phocaeicola vulgatus]